MSESAELTQVSATGILGAFEPWRKEVGEKETENSELRDSQLCEDQSICRHLMPSWTGYSLHFNLIIKKICNYLCFWTAANFIKVIIECHDLMLSVSWSPHLASLSSFFLSVKTSNFINQGFVTSAVTSLRCHWSQQKYWICDQQESCPSMLCCHITALLLFSLNETIPRMQSLKHYRFSELPTPISEEDKADSTPASTTSRDISGCHASSSTPFGHQNSTIVTIKTRGSCLTKHSFFPHRDLRSNLISLIEPGAFLGLSALKRL